MEIDTHGIMNQVIEAIVMLAPYLILFAAVMIGREIIKKYAK